MGWVKMLVAMRMRSARLRPAQHRQSRLVLSCTQGVERQCIYRCNNYHCSSYSIEEQVRRPKSNLSWLANPGTEHCTSASCIQVGVRRRT